MKTFATLAVSGLASLCLVGAAAAMPAASAPAVVRAAQAPVVNAAVVVTKRVVHPVGAVVTRRVMRRGPLGGATVTTTRTVR